MTASAAAAPAVAPPPPRPSAGQGQGGPPPPRAASNQACSTERPPGPESARRADLPQTRPTHPQIYTLQPHRTSRYKPPRDRSPRHGEGTESHHAPTPAHPAIHLPTATPHCLHLSIQHLRLLPARPLPGPRTPAHSRATRTSTHAAPAHAPPPPSEATAQHSTPILHQTRQPCQLSHSPPAPTISPHEPALDHPQAPLPSPSAPHDRLPPPTHTNTPRESPLSLTHTHTHTYTKTNPLPHTHNPFPARVLDAAERTNSQNPTSSCTYKNLQVSARPKSTATNPQQTKTKPGPQARYTSTTPSEHKTPEKEPNPPPDSIR